MIGDHCLCSQQGTSKAKTKQNSVVQLDGWRSNVEQHNKINWPNCAVEHVGGFMYAFEEYFITTKFTNGQQKQQSGCEKHAWTPSQKLGGEPLATQLMSLEAPSCGPACLPPYAYELKICNAGEVGGQGLEPLAESQAGMNFGWASGTRHV